MTADISASHDRLRELWIEIVEAHGLQNQDARKIVVACRRLPAKHDERLRGELLIHLTQRAERILRPLVGAHLRDSARDLAGEVIEDMVEAILDPSSADGRGYEVSFRGKLQKRLIDKVRREKKRSAVDRPVECDSENQPIEPVDWSSLEPEESAVIDSVLRQLPEKHRSAFLLHRQGFDYTASNKESICSMLDIDPKTAKKWVDCATKRILEELGRAP